MTQPPFRLGLTGSIGMGKSTTARMFMDAGIPVWDADAAVHRLYAPGGGGADALREHFPDVVQDDGSVSRARLRSIVAQDPQALQRLESAIHPLLAADRAAFARTSAQAGSDLIVFDIPLLFETGLDREMDSVLVVTTSAEAQRARVLATRDISEADLDALLARQMPDAQKRRGADFVIETHTLEQTGKAVNALIDHIRELRNA